MRAGVFAAIFAVAGVGVFVVFFAASPALATGAAAGAPPRGQAREAPHGPRPAEAVGDDAGPLPNRSALTDSANASAVGGPPGPSPHTNSTNADAANGTAGAHGEPCLCTFDVDRTLTGKQGVVGSTCPGNKVYGHIFDTAYGKGPLTLSHVGRSFADTFCQRCYVGIVTTGDVSGPGSKARAKVVEHLGASGRLLSSRWSGPAGRSHHHHHHHHHHSRQSCEGVKVDSPLVAGCKDGTKQHAVASIVEWHRSKHVHIAHQNVWHFDDRWDNIEAFKGTGMNARQVSCHPRKGEIGRCGAAEHEIVNKTGVAACSLI